MSVRGRLLLVGGVVLGLAGLAGAFVPGLVPDVDVVSAGVAAIAVVALAVAVALAAARLRADRRSLALPTPEGRTNAVPGDGIDRRIGALSRTGPHDDEPSTGRRALQARIERAAHQVLAREGADVERIREQLAAGTWTDDPHAAAFFTDTTVERASTRELRALWTGEPPIARRARHAIGALTRRFERDPPSISAGDTDHEGGEGERSVSVRPLPPETRESGADQRTRTSKSEDRADIDERRFPAAGESIDHPTARWRGATGVALAAGAIGIVLRRPSLLLASAVGVGLAAYARAATTPTIALDVERSVSDPRPAVGDDVVVTVTVRNAGDSLCPDCAVIDGVPSGLVVTDGSPRHGVALRPGKATTFSYTLTAVRGDHRFTPAKVIARDASGSVERLARVQVSGSVAITCVPQPDPLTDVALRTHAERFGGRMPTAATGSGVTFHATREYRPGDPPARIDWNRLAKTGDLSTLQFRAERVPIVVVVIDARPTAFLAPDPDERSAVERSVEAAGRIVTTLLDDATRVGVGALSTHPERCWLAPDTGEAHRERARRLLATHPALAARRGDPGVDPSADTHTAPDGAEPGDGDRDPGAWLRRRLPADAQVVVLSPLCDDGLAAWIRRVDAAGRPASVVSPDPTTTTSPGRQLARVERALRITDLRSAGIPVLDRSGSADEPLSTAMAHRRAGGGSGATRGANAGWTTR